jgi:hypothetical protein
MKFVHRLLLFVATLSFIQHSKKVEGQILNFGIVDKIRSTIYSVFHNKPQRQSAPSQYNSTTYFPMAQTSNYVVPTNIPIYSEGIQQEPEVSTLPQDAVNDTVQDYLDGRALIDAPLINGKCEAGFRAVNGRCRKVFGGRRRRR